MRGRSFQRERLKVSLATLTSEFSSSLVRSTRAKVRSDEMSTTLKIFGYAPPPHLDGNRRRLNSVHRSSISTGRVETPKETHTHTHTQKQRRGFARSILFTRAVRGTRGETKSSSSSSRRVAKGRRNQRGTPDTGALIYRGSIPSWLLLVFFPRAKTRPHGSWLPPEKNRRVAFIPDERNYSGSR